jgi:hypothetical protein
MYAAREGATSGGPSSSVVDVQKYDSLDVVMNTGSMAGPARLPAVGTGARV